MHFLIILIERGPYLHLAETYYYNHETKKAILILEKAKQSKYAKVPSETDSPIDEYININIINNKLSEYKQKLYVETTYPYNQKQVRELVRTKLQEQNININFTQPKLAKICDYFKLKSNDTYFYNYPESKVYRCSRKLVDLLVNSFLQNNELIDYFNLLQ